MKEITKGLKFRTLLTFLLVAFIQTLVWAQEGSSESGSSTTSKSVTVTSESTEWYAAPWIWVVGAVVLILLLAGLFRGRGSNASTAATRTDRVTVTKSSTTDDF